LGSKITVPSSFVWRCFNGLTDGGLIATSMDLSRARFE
jgi:hypothetical protein